VLCGTRPYANEDELIRLTMDGEHRSRTTQPMARHRHTSLTINATMGVVAVNEETGGQEVYDPATLAKTCRRCHCLHTDSRLLARVLAIEGHPHRTT